MFFEFLSFVLPLYLLFSAIMTLKGGEIMDMHKKILAFAVSLETNELNVN